jgi:hypothetical protein
MTTIIDEDGSGGGGDARFFDEKGNPIDITRAGGGGATVQCKRVTCVRFTRGCDCPIVGMRVSGGDWLQCERDDRVVFGRHVAGGGT